jgi:GMP synthase-like glutamine amidotransferase
VSEAGRGRLLVVENAAGSPLGRFEEWWREDGLDVHILKAHSEPLPPLGGYDGLVILGGGMMPNADDASPWLPRERELVAEAVETELPTLGICLGGQMLALVGGGDVRAKYGSPESGSTALDVHGSAAGDELFSALPGRVHAIEHHEDTITKLPASAVLLASSERCENQAFRLGRRAWGLQFHPEAPASRVAGWDRDRLVEQGFDPDTVVREAETNEPESLINWRGFARRFARVVAEHAASPSTATN